MINKLAYVVLFVWSCHLFGLIHFGAEGKTSDIDNYFYMHIVRLCFAGELFGFGHGHGFGHGLHFPHILNFTALFEIKCIKMGGVCRFVDDCDLETDIYFKSCGYNKVKTVLPPSLYIFKGILCPLTSSVNFSLSFVVFRERLCVS